MKTFVRLIILALALTLYVNCEDETGRNVSQAPEQLDDGWNVASPARFAANIALLDSMLYHIETGHFVGIHSVLLAVDGTLVLERYFDGNDRSTPHEMRSATKSIGSVLTGIALDKGFLLSENESIYKYFEKDYVPADGWTDQARKIQVRHLLSMMSGLDCDDLATHFACENAMHRADDWVQYALDLPFAHAPGEVWAYNSASLILVGEAIGRTSGIKLDEFADRYLFEPMGIKSFRWQFSPRGRAWIGGGARMIPREMAKIGQLMLNRGVWRGQTLLSKEWIDKSTKKQGEMPMGVDYGYLWQTSQTYVGLDIVTAFWASGNGGQYIIIIPTRRMVVVFTGGNYDSPLASQPFHMLTRFILPAFLDHAPLKEVLLNPKQLEALTGTYRLDFEPSATSVISIHNDRIRLLSPDGESIDLIAHSPTFFTGDSRYGLVTVVFEIDEHGKAFKQSIYGSFQKFVFERK